MRTHTCPLLLLALVICLPLLAGSCPKQGASRQGAATTSPAIKTQAPAAEVSATEEAELPVAAENGPAADWREDLAFLATELQVLAAPGGQPLAVRVTSKTISVAYTEDATTALRDAGVSGGGVLILCKTLRSVWETKRTSLRCTHCVFTTGTGKRGTAGHALIDLRDRIIDLRGNENAPVRLSSGTDETETTIAAMGLIVNLEKDGTCRIRVQNRVSVAADGRRGHE